MATGQDDSVSGDKITFSGSRGVTVAGRYECTSGVIQTISDTAAQVQASATVTGSGQATVPCPTAGPARYTLTIVPPEGRYQRGALSVTGVSDRIIGDDFSMFNTQDSVRRP